MTVRRRRTPAGLVVAAALAAAVLGSAPAASAAATRPVVLQVRPVTPGVVFVLHGRRYVSDARGRVTLPASPKERAHGGALLRARLRIPPRTVAPGRRMRFGRWVGATPTVVLHAPVRVVLTDPAGRELDGSEAPEVVVRGSDGSRPVLRSDRTTWLPAVRAVVTPRGDWRRRSISYTVQEVRAHGVNVVHRNQQRFKPVRTPRVQVRALFFSARVTVRDALFARRVGRAVVVRFPDGHAERRPLDDTGHVLLTGLARGEYQVSVDGPGLSFARPVSLSRSQDVDLRVISRLDVVVVGGTLLVVVVGLAVAHRVLRRRRRRSRRRTTERELIHG